MDENILREAVELAEGWKFKAHDPMYVPLHSLWAKALIYAPGLGRSWHKSPRREVIAALASQLISQIDSMNEYEVWPQKQRTTVIKWHDLKSHAVECHNGPNRDENSIIACVSFLRGLK